LKYVGKNNKFSIGLYSIVLAQSLIVHYIVHKFQWTHSTTLLKVQALVTAVLLNIEQIVFQFQRQSELNECFIILYFTICLLVSFRFTHVYSIIFVIMLMFGFYVDRVIKLIHDNSNFQENLNLIMTFLIFIIWFLYIYSEESINKVKFIAQYHAVKEY
jgi:hypothetical protein